MSRMSPIYQCLECGVDLGTTRAWHSSVSDLHLCPECYDKTLGRITGYREDDLSEFGGWSDPSVPVLESLIKAVTALGRRLDQLEARL